MNRRFGGAFAVTLAAQLVNNLKGLVVLPIMVRYSGPASYGAYVLLILSLAQIFELLTTGVTYRYSRNLVSTHDFADRRRLFEPQFTFQLLVFATIAACLLLAGPGIRELFVASDVAVNSWFLVALLGSNMLSGWVAGYYRGTLRFVPFNAVLGGGTLVFMAALGLVAVVTGNLSLDTVLAVQALANFAVSVPFLVIMLREIGLPRPRLSPRVLIADVRAGISITLDMVVDFILGSSDRYLITFFLSILDVARYQPPSALASVVLFFPRLVVTVLTPVVAGMIDARNIAGAERVITISLRSFLMIGVPFVVGMLMVGPSIIAVLTNVDMAMAGRWVVPLVAAAAIFSGMLWILDAIAIGFKRPRLILDADVKGAVVNVALNLVFLPWLHSITVPAAATLIGRALATTSLILSLRGLWRLHIEWAAIFRFCAAAAAMAVLLWFLGYRPAAVAPVSIVTLVGGIAAGAATYFAALAALGGFGRREWAEILTLMRSGTPEPERETEIGHTLLPSEEP